MIFLLLKTVRQELLLWHLSIYAILFHRFSHWYEYQIVDQKLHLSEEFFSWVDSFVPTAYDNQVPVIFDELSHLWVSRIFVPFLFNELLSNFSTTQTSIQTRGFKGWIGLTLSLLQSNQCLRLNWADVLQSVCDLFRRNSQYTEYHFPIHVCLCG